MTKPFDSESFARHVESDFTWRVREISDLKAGVKAATTYRQAVSKAALPLTYAHWEGHVKFVSESYLTFISRRKILISKLTKNFTAVALHNFFEQISGQNFNYNEKIELIDRIHSAFRGQLRSIPKDYLNTGGNLRYDRFCDICKIINVSPANVTVDRDFLDKKIVDKRNHIAHGSDKILNLDELEDIMDYTIEAMRSFRDQVVNLVALEAYKLEK